MRVKYKYGKKRPIPSDDSLDLILDPIRTPLAAVDTNKPKLLVTPAKALNSTLKTVVSNSTLKTLVSNSTLKTSNANSTVNTPNPMFTNVQNIVTLHDRETGRTNAKIPANPQNSQSMDLDLISIESGLTRKHSDFQKPKVAATRKLAGFHQVTQQRDNQAKTTTKMTIYPQYEPLEIVDIANLHVQAEDQVKNLSNSKNIVDSAPLALQSMDEDFMDINTAKSSKKRLHVLKPKLAAAKNNLSDNFKQRQESTNDCMSDINGQYIPLSSMDIDHFDVQPANEYRNSSKSKNKAVKKKIIATGLENDFHAVNMDDQTVKGSQSFHVDNKTRSKLHAEKAAISGEHSNTHALYTTRGAPANGPSTLDSSANDDITVGFGEFAHLKVY